MSNRDPKKIIVAIDFASEKAAMDMIALLDPALCRIKIGKQLFTYTGPSVVKKAIAKGFEVFLDLKYHDIPNTVAQACQAAADLGVWMINVHASGGRKMLSAAKSALQNIQNPPLLIAVTTLTSMDENELAELGLPAPTIWVNKLAKLSQSCGLDGIVCSAQEASSLRAAYGEEFKLITPGIRLMDSITSDDQARIMSPQGAIAEGADYLVIGRPITQSESPQKTFLTIYQSIQSEVNYED